MSASFAIFLCQWAFSLDQKNVKILQCFLRYLWQQPEAEEKLHTIYLLDAQVLKLKHDLCYLAPMPVAQWLFPYLHSKM